MVDASKGFIKDGNKNRLRARDIHQVVDVFTKQIEVPKYSRMVALKEISDNDYNLNIPRYIDASSAEDLHDLSGHLQGGIPNADIDALSGYWQVFPSLRACLFAPARAGYSQGLVSASAVKSTILAHPEFTAFASQSLAPLNTWKSNAKLDTIAQGDQPKAWIDRLSESLLSAYSNSQLIDKYAIYQLLMDYWAETLQDDVYVLVQDGWTAGNRLRELVVTKGEKLKETPNLVIGKAKYKAELIPPALIIARYFSAQQTTLEQLQSEVDNLSQQIESLIEEHSGDDGLLLDAMNDKDKVTKATVKTRLKHAKDADEVALLKQLVRLFDAEDTAKKAAKDAQESLDMAVFGQYAKLSESDIKTLIVQDKWLASVQSAVEADIERITQQLANRVKELEERYAQPLPQLEADVLALSAKVAEHLKAMGLSL
jgi:type I restriction enzyme M protein